MKPVTLTLQNFGPFTHEVIQFEKFAQRALFLISGKTGAGKTTIFDGICYALFGESSGQLRQSKELRSTFSAATEETLVHFCFTHRAHIYEITRKPEQELAKKRGTGTRVQTAKTELIVKNQAGKELKCLTKQREVNQYIKELLHLDAAQFAQIVLLPQGEFRRFLIATSGEKEKVLRNLFGTQLYQKLAELLKEQVKQKRAAIAQAEQTMQIKLEQAFWPTDQPMPSEEAAPEQLAGLAHVNEKLKQRLTEQEKNCQDLQQLVQKKEAEQQSLVQLAATFAEQEEVTQKLTSLAEQALEIECLREEKAKMSWLNEHLHQLERLHDLTHEAERLDQQLTKRQQELAGVETAHKESQEAYAKHQASLPAQSVRQQQISQWQQQLPFINDYQTLWDEQQALMREQQTVQANLAQEQAKQENLNQQHTRLAERVAQKATLAQQELALVQQATQWQQFCEQWRALQKIDQKLLEQSVDSQQLTTDWLQAQEAYEASQQEVRQLKSDWARWQIHQLQALLIDGEPCPVCGSFEHPVKKQPSTHDLIAPAITEAHVQQAEAQLTQKAQIVTELATKKGQAEAAVTETQQAKEEQQQVCGALQAQVATFWSTVGTITMTASLFTELDRKLQVEQKQLKEQQAKVVEAEQSLAQLTEQLTAQMATIQQVAQTYEQQQQQVTTLAGKLELLAEQISLTSVPLVETTVVQLEQQLEELEALSTAWETEQLTLEQGLHEQQTQIEKLTYQQEQQQQQVQETKEKIAQAETDFREAALAKGYTFTPLQVSYWKAELAQLQALAKKIQDYETEQATLKAQQQRLANLLQAQKVPDLAPLAAEIEALTAEKTAQEAAYHQLNERYKMNQQIYRELEQLQQKMGAQWMELTEYNQLFAVINGDNAKKTSLERYVLQTYLLEVLKLANQQLAQLSQRRYQFELNQTSGSYKNQTGLEINVYDDNAGATRSAHTLSGGESFIAALALALALAEVIQNESGGVVIEALFIDEGFGSLDEDALETAITALETLESTGRMIGIISHVKELKDRIPQQMQIQTDGTGRSEIQYQLTK